MTWQGKRRKQLPSNWASIRKARLEYDGYRCTAYLIPVDLRVAGLAPNQSSVTVDGKVFDYLLVYGTDHRLYRCPARATEVDHHLDPHDHRLSSLRSLCHAHHMEKTQAEATAARAKVARKRTPQPHPGLR